MGQPGTPPSARRRWLLACVRQLLACLRWQTSNLRRWQIWGILSNGCDAVGSRALARGPFLMQRTDYIRNSHDETYHDLGPADDPDPSRVPNHDVCQEGQHYVRSRAYWVSEELHKFYEIGQLTLKQALEQGEMLDLGFARRMQGLAGISQDAAWACLDPAFNPADRKEVLDRFTGSYTAGFYKQVGWPACCLWQGLTIRQSRSAGRTTRTPAPSPWRPCSSTRRRARSASFLYAYSS